MKIIFYWLLTLVVIGQAFGLIILSYDDALLFANAIAGLLATFLLFFGHDAHRVKHKLTVFIVLLFSMLPMLFFHSVVNIMFQRLGWHSLTIIAIVITYILPIILACIFLYGLRVHRVASNAQNVLVGGVSIALTVFLLEIALRVIGFGTTTQELPQLIDLPTRETNLPNVPYVMAPNATWGHRYPSNERGYFDENNAVYYTMNAQGYRDDDFVLERTPNTIRIAFLGDSFGFGSGIKTEDQVTLHLEDLLTEQAGCPVEVYNFAIWGYSTVTEASILENVALSYDPDLVVVWYFLNDADVDATIAFLGGDDATGIFPIARQQSRFVAVIARVIDNLITTEQLIVTYQDAYLTDDPRWQAVERAFERMVQISAGQSADVALFIHPILFRLSNYPLLDVHEEIIRSADNAGMQAFDLYPAFENQIASELWVHPLDQHPNDIGHDLAAQYAAEQLLPLLPPCNNEL